MKPVTVSTTFRFRQPESLSLDARGFREWSMTWGEMLTNDWSGNDLGIVAALSPGESALLPGEGSVRVTRVERCPHGFDIDDSRSTDPRKHCSVCAGTLIPAVEAALRAVSKVERIWPNDDDSNEAYAESGLHDSLDEIVHYWACLCGGLRQIHKDG